MIKRALAFRARGQFGRAEAILGRGISYEKLGEIEKARADLETGLALYPDDGAFARMLRQLGRN